MLLVGFLMPLIIILKLGFHQTIPYCKITLVIYFRWHRVGEKSVPVYSLDNPWDHE